MWHHPWPISSPARGASTGCYYAQRPCTRWPWRSTPQQSAVAADDPGTGRLPPPATSAAGCASAPAARRRCRPPMPAGGAIRDPGEGGHPGAPYGWAFHRIWPHHPEQAKSQAETRRRDPLQRTAVRWGQSRRGREQPCRPHVDVGALALTGRNIGGMVDEVGRDKHRTKSSIRAMVEHPLDLSRCLGLSEFPIGVWRTTPSGSGRHAGLPLCSWSGKGHCAPDGRTASEVLLRR